MFNGRSNLMKKVIGGIDHAAILLREDNAFLKIKFNPLPSESVSAPDDLEMILFHSLIEAEKSSFDREAYTEGC